jgi:hypothetical protein
MTRFPPSIFNPEARLLSAQQLQDQGVELHETTITFPGLDEVLSLELGATSAFLSMPLNY